MAPKRYRAAEVCEMTQVQPYVLRSWEKEFPGIGVQKSDDAGARLYRQADVEQVLRIKQLVFGEGLTLAGARRRLEQLSPFETDISEEEAAEVISALGADVKKRIQTVRQGLRTLLSLLSDEGRRIAAGETVAEAGPATGASNGTRAKGRQVAARPKASAKNKISTRTKAPVLAKASAKAKGKPAKRKTTRLGRIGT
jgi:DNA-binding transcriptional MerR regulator